MYFSPSGMSNGGSMMLVPDSPSLGPVSLYNSPTKMFLAQTPPIGSAALDGAYMSAGGLRNGSSLSRNNSSTSLYQQQIIFQRQQQLQQQLQQQQQQQIALSQTDAGLTGDSIFHVLEKEAGPAPPKQSGISKTFSKQSDATFSHSTTSSSATAPDPTMANPTNLSRDPPPLRSLQASSEDIHHSKALQQQPQSILSTLGGSANQANSKNSNSSADSDSKTEAIAVTPTVLKSTTSAAAPAPSVVLPAAPASTAVTLATPAAPHTTAVSTTASKSSSISAPSTGSTDTTSNTAVPSKPLSEREIREKQKVSKTAAAITLALTALENEEKEERERWTLKKKLEQHDKLQKQQTIHAPAQHVTQDRYIDQENDEDEISAFNTPEKDREDLPSYLQGKVLGASSTPIAIPASGNKKASRGQLLDDDVDEVNGKNESSDAKSKQSSQDPAINTNVDSAQQTSTNINATTRANAANNNLGAATSPTGALHHTGSASNMRALMSPTSARHRQSQVNISSLTSHLTSGLSLNGAGSATIGSPLEGARTRSSSNLYANHHSLQPQLTATAIDEDSDLISPTVPPPVSISGQLGPTLNMSSSVTSLNSLALQPSTPDSPGLYPVSMTPFEAGLMTPMTLDPLSSRHASLASVDHFFRAGGAGMPSMTSLTSMAPITNIGAISSGGLNTNNTASSFAPAGNQPSNLHQRLQGLQQQAAAPTIPEDKPPIESSAQVSHPLDTLRKSSEGVSK